MRVYNFSAGPSMLPLEVLERVQRDIVDYRGVGMSVMEMSHRSKPYEEINARAEALLRELMNIPDDYDVLFVQGGATNQFSAVPLNIGTGSRKADYVISGNFSQKAFEVHICYNNTIFGTRFTAAPDTGKIPLVADMSSMILSEEINVKDFSLIYAGAQKNIGPAGVTVVIVKHDLTNRADPKCPVMLRYADQVKNKSLYNTPPCFSTYVVAEVLQYLKERGGIPAVQKINERKAKKLYDYIDASDFYSNSVEKSCRSLMNVPFVSPDKELDDMFVKQAATRGLVSIKGHRLVGGMRASIYNAMPEEGVDALIAFMDEFAKNNG